MILRPVEPDDLPALRNLFLQSRRATFVWEPPGSLAIEDFDSQTDGEWQLVAFDEGRLAGFISVWQPDDFIHHLHVHPQALRRGIGHALLQALPGWPTRRYRLKCVSRNAAAVAFYRAHGFAQVGGGRAADEDYLLLESGGEGDR